LILYSIVPLHFINSIIVMLIAFMCD
jgi:hypothetical protein